MERRSSEANGIKGHSARLQELKCQTLLSSTPYLACVVLDDMLGSLHKKHKNTCSRVYSMLTVAQAARKSRLQEAWCRRRNYADLFSM